MLTELDGMLDYIITYNLPPRPFNPALSGPWLSYSPSRFIYCYFSDLKFHRFFSLIYGGGRLGVLRTLLFF